MKLSNKVRKGKISSVSINQRYGSLCRTGQLCLLSRSSAQGNIPCCLKLSVGGKAEFSIKCMKLANTRVDSLSEDAKYQQVILICI